MSEMVRRTAVGLLLVSLLLAGACNQDPKATLIPGDPAKWVTDLGPSIQRLDKSDQEIAQSYLARMKAPDGSSTVPVGTSLGQAVEAERAYKVAVVATQTAQAEQAAAATATTVTRNAQATATVQAREAEAVALRERLERERAALQEQIDAAVVVSFLGKGFLASDFRAGRISDTLTFRVAFENRSSKTIAVTRGVMRFTDLLGEPVMNLRITYDRAVPPGQAGTWNGTLDYNQFMSTHVRFRNTPQDRLQSRFVTEAILFEDGTRLDLPNPQSESSGV